MFLVPRTESLLDTAFKDFFSESSWSRTTPPADIVENENGYEIEMHVPGISKDDLNIEAKNNILTVSGERKRVKKDGGRYETYCGKFSRSWYIDKVDTSKIQADYKDGILKLNLPKADSIKPKKIEVK